ncbi:general stress protein [Paenibacillus tuaregi]|uniref:general stress protein n=1 Tax=Paenibacillus tuaregi TaxID=1816681 RepID=UPI000839521F|nr:general stress protein [Paenibacillus tuaregi]
MAKLLIGIFSTTQDASIVIDELYKTGYSDKEVSVLSRKLKQMNKISESTGIGKPMTGNAGNSVFGMLKNMVANIEDDPKEVVAAGPAARKMAGTEIGKGTDDFIVPLMSAGVPKEDAQQYEAHLLKGHVLVMVECEPHEADRVANIFKAHHVVEIE